MIKIVQILNDMYKFVNSSIIQYLITRDFFPLLKKSFI